MGGLGSRGATRSVGATGAVRLDVKVGFVDKRPRDREFGGKPDAEIARVAEFLQPPPT